MNKNNSFDLLRLFAASSVLASHCFPLSGYVGDEPVTILTNLGSLGDIAVAIFFVISGFLVTGSYLRCRTWVDYLAKRALRLLPALWCAVLLTVFVLGPLLTQVHLNGYFADPSTRAYLANLYLDVHYRLPGLFADNPYRYAVNGSLWTLPIEVLMYFLVLVLGAMRQLNLVTCLGMALLFAILHFFVPLTASFHYPSYWMTLLPYREMTELGVYFFLGAAIFFIPPTWMRYRRYTIIAALLLLLLFADTIWAPAVAMALLPYVVIATAQTYGRWSEAVSRIGDFSYGVYIYAFPIQQICAMWLGPAVSPLPLFLVSMPATLVVACLSWYLVEKPALAWKTRVLS